MVAHRIAVRAWPSAALPGISKGSVSATLDGLLSTGYVRRGSAMPQGLVYAGNLIAPADGDRLVERFRALPFRAFDFHGFKGLRRVVSFGWRYDFGAGRLTKADPIPDFLQPLLRAAAGFARLDPVELRHALVTEYASGAPIGWHRGQGGVRQSDRGVLSFSLRPAIPPSHGERLGPVRTEPGAPLRLSAGRRGPAGLGTQYRAGAGSALFCHLSHLPLI